MTKRSSIKRTKQRLQKEDFAAKFAEISPDIAAEDKKELVDSKIVSQPTLSRYLNGDIADTGIAHKILIYLQKKIAERSKILA